MGFEVVQPVGAEHLIWVPIDANATTGDTFYVGQLVKFGGDGVQPLGQASGAADTSTKAVPAGVIVGTNLLDDVYDTTYKANSISSVTPTQAIYAASKKRTVNMGMHMPGDNHPMVLIHKIYPHTWIKGPIYNAALGTAITQFANTAESTTGLTVTKASTIGFTPVADLCTLYCRSGANKGQYRITDNTSTTTYTTDSPFSNDIAVNDEFVYAPLRLFGTSYCQTDAESMYIEGGTSASLATNYWIVEVVYLDLATAGAEYAVFQFGMDHFCKARA